jgi:hypothetical protein
MTFGGLCRRKDQAMDWSGGYVTDIGYMTGYISELNPHRAALPLLQAGIAPPQTEFACELGYGQGFTLGVHAAASTVAWWGADVNPSHAANAQSLLQAGPGDAFISDEAFAEFCARPDLPDFDFIGLHGVWSWVDDDNKRVIADFLRRKLKVGGVVYISYNTLPGWNAMAPIRQLMAQHQASLSPPGAGRAARVEAALAFADKLLQLDPLYLRAAPTTTERFAAIQKMDRRYLAHEYFNASWTPYYFAEMHEVLSASKLSFAGSCHPVDHVDAMNHTPEQIAFLQSIPDSVLRQTARDIFVNQQFRRDYWIKGPRRIDGALRDQALMDLTYVLMRPAAEAPLKAPGGRGEVNLKADLFRAIPEAMGDHKPVSGRELLDRVRDKNLTWRAVQDALLVMASTGTVSLVQPNSAVRDPSAFNAHLIGLARSRDSYSYLASPVTGGGVPVNRLHQLMLAARAEGAVSPMAQAQSVQAMLAAHGERVAVNQDGRPGEPQEELAVLTRSAEALAKDLPILEALGVVPDGGSGQSARRSAA